MMLPVVLRDEARAEFDEAFDWYNGERAGLGPEFLSEVQAEFALIAAMPLARREACEESTKAWCDDFHTVFSTGRIMTASK